MPKPTRQDFAFLNDAKIEAILFDLYTAAVRQIPGLIWHFLPQLPKLLGKGSGWTGENEAYFDDKYIPIAPQQGAFLYMQALAKGAKNIVEFGTSYGISTLYLAAAAKKNGGRVITTEYLPHKAEAARRHFAAAGLSDYIELREGNALETLQDIASGIDFVLLDGWPNLVYPVFKLLEPKLALRAAVAVDDVEGYTPAMQDYLDYVRNPAKGYVSATLKPHKALEYSVKTGGRMPLEAV